MQDEFEKDPPLLFYWLVVIIPFKEEDEKLPDKDWAIRIFYAFVIDERYSNGYFPYLV